MTNVPLGEPLATTSTGVPLLYPVLGAVLHLEPMALAHESALEAVNDMIWDWYGSALRWVNMTFEPATMRADRGQADYIPGYVRQLEIPASDDPVEQAVFTGHAQFANDDFEVAFCGGTTGSSASPYSYRFWAEAPDPHAERVLSYGVIHLTVPEAWPLHDFEERVSSIVAALPVRWGAAGYTYSPWMLSDIEKPTTKAASHASRYPGYDIADYTRLVKQFYKRIRTVNWLTFIGASMMEELSEAGRVLESASRLTVTHVGASTLVRAGDRPEKGDTNRLLYPPAYVEADELLRSVRAHSAEGMIFAGPWDERKIEEWLKRFEKRVN